MLRPDLAFDYDNLLYACVSCNLSKGQRDTPDPLAVLLDPEAQVRDDGSIHATTASATKLIELLGLNRPRLREFRALWIRIIRRAAVHDPAFWRRLLGFPSDLPDLSELRPPEGNGLPDGVLQSHFARRERGELPDIY